jgi:hypothetical protein
MAISEQPEAVDKCSKVLQEEPKTDDYISAIDLDVG